MFAEVPKFEAPVAAPADAPELSGGRVKGAKNRSKATRERRMAEILRIRNSLSHRQRTRGYKFKHYSPRTRIYRQVLKSIRARSRKPRKHAKNCPKGSNRMASGECKRRSPRRSGRSRKPVVRYSPSGGDGEVTAAAK
jgi:hypothetical protein